MIKHGHIAEKDILGTEFYRIADGSIKEGTSIIIRELKFGPWVLKDVKASVSHSIDAPLLLGQSALSKLGKIQIDYAEDILSVISN
jgi:aspartyl protease family protein